MIFYGLCELIAEMTWIRQNHLSRLNWRLCATLNIQGLQLTLIMRIFAQLGNILPQGDSTTCSTLDRSNKSISNLSTAFSSAFSSPMGMTQLSEDLNC